MLIGGVVFMRYSFCKNSVFCVQFFTFFFLGTICGILLLRVMLISDCAWLREYCACLRIARFGNRILMIWFLFLPLLAAVGLYFIPHRNNLFPILFFVRGCLLSYAVGATYTQGLPLGDILFCNLLMLPLFFALCRRLWSDAPN